MDWQNVEIQTPSSSLSNENVVLSIEEGDTDSFSSFTNEFSVKDDDDFASCDILSSLQLRRHNLICVLANQLSRQAEVIASLSKETRDCTIENQSWNCLLDIIHERTNEVIRLNEELLAYKIKVFDLASRK